MTKSELDLLKPAAPGMDEPLEILEACHGRIEHQLQTLGRLLAHLPRAGADNQAASPAETFARETSNECFGALKRAASSFFGSVTKRRGGRGEDGFIGLR